MQFLPHPFQAPVQYLLVGILMYVHDRRQHREQNIGIENQIVNNVKTPADLAGLAVLVALRGGDFFGSLVAPPGLK